MPLLLTAHLLPPRRLLKRLAPRGGERSRRRRARMSGATASLLLAVAAVAFLLRRRAAPVRRLRPAFLLRPPRRIRSLRLVVGVVVAVGPAVGINLPGRSRLRRRPRRCAEMEGMTPRRTRRAGLLQLREPLPSIPRVFLGLLRRSPAESSQNWATPSSTMILDLLLLTAAGRSVVPEKRVPTVQIYLSW